MRLSPSLNVQLSFEKESAAGFREIDYLIDSL